MGLFGEEVAVIGQSNFAERVALLRAIYSYKSDVIFDWPQQETPGDSS